MKNLTDIAWEMVNSEENEISLESIEAEHRFIEVLTFSSAEDITNMLNELLAGENILLLPVWARNLAFRLVCLLEPQNAEIRKLAAGDLELVGPDWDLEVQRLRTERDEILKSGQRVIKPLTPNHFPPEE